MKREYKGNERTEIRFPIGGIGTGCIGLDGAGRFREWEIFNRPNKGDMNGFSHFGIKAEQNGKTIDARVMNADHVGPLMGEGRGYGFGIQRSFLTGVPHFKDSIFHGEFPFAEVEFVDDTFPGKVKLSAFNPFIPSNEDDSGIPAAFFTASVTNDTDAPIDYTFELSVKNPSAEGHENKLVSGSSFQGIELSDDTPEEAVKHGSVLIAMPADEQMQAQQYWYRAGWFGNLGVFWQNFTAPGTLQNRVYEPYEKKEDLATIAVRFAAAPGETVSKRFLIAWYYPNCVNYWSEHAATPGDSHPYEEKIWKNYYAKQFASASAVAEYAMGEWNRMQNETQLFHDALFACTLPDAAVEAISATISVLKSPTVMRLENGAFYGWEGCGAYTGSCEGSCTHVWNYQFALPFLFPRLERSMREMDFDYNQSADGRMSFRLQLPLGTGPSPFRACVDGQMGGIIKTYREWKLMGDDEWLRRLWSKVKKSLEYAWAPTNTDRWDTEKSGVITGRQHHTLDMELFGPSSWLNGFYVGALKAASEMASAMGDPDATEYRKLYEQGRAYTDRELFNGEYYCQKVDIRDKDILTPYADGQTLTGGKTVETYWNDEAKQLKFQIAGGCIIDQVLAQWMCELSGVGEILDREHVDSALKAIYKHNYRTSMRGYFNPCRIFAMDDEAGLVICSWPEGVEKPVVPIPYAEESMHGFEYQAASHMILHGLEKEGEQVVASIRARYDGTRRNPWNEIECGSNYARSMASYGLMLAYSGFTFDMRQKKLGCKPLHDGTYFWACDGAWGSFAKSEGKAEMTVLYGSLTLNKWVIPSAETSSEVKLNGEEQSFTKEADCVNFARPITLSKGMKLTAKI